LVFEEHLVSMAELLQALSADFVGHQATLALCREHAPKYGNDDDHADQLAARIVESFGRLMRAYPSPSPRAVHYGMVGSVVSHTSMGQATAASANGRRASGTLSDGGSPSQGCNRTGATATLRSMAKPDYRRVPGGAALNATGRVQLPARATGRELGGSASACTKQGSLPWWHSTRRH